MSEYTNVTISKKANIYFDGNVTSRAIVFPDGTRKTLGMMLPGEYEFSTTEKEKMEILAGELEYKLTGQAWNTIENEGVFYVPANESFLLKVYSVVDYHCSYMTELRGFQQTKGDTIQSVTLSELWMFLLFVSNE